MDELGNKVYRVNTLFGKIQHHAHFMQANVEGRMRVDKAIQRRVFVPLTNLAAHLHAVFAQSKSSRRCAHWLRSYPAENRCFRVDQLKAHYRPCGIMLVVRLIFLVDAGLAHDCDDVYRLLLPINRQPL